MSKGLNDNFVTRAYTFTRKHLAIPIAFSVFLGGFLLLSFNSMLTDSNTIDEKYHFTRGIMLLKTGDYRINQHHPFLGNVITAIPELFDKDLALPELTSKEWQQADKQALSEEVIEKNGGTKGFTENVLRGPRTLMILIATAFLPLFFYLVRKEFGFKTASIATILMGTSATYIAHARLVTTDIPAIVTMFLATWSLYYYLKTHTLKSFLLLILFSCLAVLSKYTAVLLVAISGLFVIIDRVVNSEPIKFQKPTNKQKFFYFANNLLKGIGKGALYGIALLFLMTAAYKFQFATPKDMQYGAESKYQDTYGNIQQLKEATHNNRLVDLTTFIYEKAKFPFPQYVYGFYENVIKHNFFGHQSFLLGERSNGGWWHYFPVAYITKESITTVFFTIFSTIISIVFLIRSKAIRKGLKLEHYALIAIPAVILYISINSSLNLGIRHLLPLFPFIFLLIGIVLARLISSNKKHLIWIIVLLTLGAYEIVASYPNYIDFFNMAIPSDKKLYYLRDSNLDWRQENLNAEIYVNDHTELDIKTDIANIPTTGGYLIIAARDLYGKTEKMNQQNLWIMTQVEAGNIKIVDQIASTHYILYLDNNPYGKESEL